MMLCVVHLPCYSVPCVWSVWSWCICLCHPLTHSPTCSSCTPLSSFLPPVHPAPLYLLSHHLFFLHPSIFFPTTCSSCTPLSSFPPPVHPAPLYLLSHHLFILHPSIFFPTTCSSCTSLSSFPPPVHPAPLYLLSHHLSFLHPSIFSPTTCPSCTPPSSFPPPVLPASLLQDIEDLDFYRRAGLIAHEMGHNLGFYHDEDGCKCPDDFCLMEAIMPWVGKIWVSTYTFLLVVIHVCKEWQKKGPMSYLNFKLLKYLQVL